MRASLRTEADIDVRDTDFYYVCADGHGEAGRSDSESGIRA